MLSIQAERTIQFYRMPLLALVVFTVGCSADSGTPHSSAVSSGSTQVTSSTEAPDSSLLNDILPTVPDEPMSDDAEPSSPSTPVSDDAPPSAPVALQAVAYTFEEIELFWENPVGSTAVVWEIRRDGQIIGMAPGPSFYETGLSAQTTYTYTVEPIDENQTRGPAVTLSVTTPADAPIITRDTAAALTETLVEALSLSTMPRVFETLREDYYSLFPSPPYEGLVNCPQGGTAEVAREAFIYGQTAGGLTASFNNCEVNSRRLTGTVQLIQQSYNRQTGPNNEHASCTTRFTDFHSSTGNSLPIETHGQLTGSGELQHDLHFQGKLIERKQLGSIIIDADLKLNLGYFDRVTGRFTYQSQQTGNRALNVTLSGDNGVRYDNGLPRDGSMKVTGPSGASMVITFDYKNQTPVWNLVVYEPGRTTQLPEQTADGTLNELSPWPVGSDCQLLYPPNGIPLAQSGDIDVPPEHPLAPNNLNATLTTVFDVQRSAAVERVFTDLAAFNKQSRFNALSVTDVPSAEATLLEETRGTYEQVNEQTGELETGSYLVFGVQEQQVVCAMGGTLTDAVKYAGPMVLSAVVADQCRDGDSVMSARLTGDWVKYSSYTRIEDYDHIQPNDQLSAERVVRTTSSALSYQSRSGTNLSWRNDDQMLWHISETKGSYNADWTVTTGVVQRPASYINATIEFGQPTLSFFIENIGALHNNPDTDLSEQGSLLVSASDGSSLTIDTGNGDNESFDVRVTDSSGNDYALRLPYTEAHHFRFQ